MSIPVEILAAASVAVAGTMGTDAYQFARQWVKGLIDQRTESGSDDSVDLARLDALEAAVTALGPEERPIMARGVQAPIAEILTSCVDEANIDALRDLTRTLEKHMVELQPTGSQQTVTGNLAGGSINTAGRDNNFGTVR